LITLRPDQAALKQGIYDHWQSGAQNVVGVLPTGGGKSIIVSDIVLDRHNQGARQCIIAHRNELVGQMSMHVARRGIKHRIIGSKSTIAGIVQEHRAEFGRSLVNPDAGCAVGSVQTIVSRADDLKQWAAQIDDWTLDEAHHLLRENQWGQAVRLFTNARGLGVTACTIRADGMGTGRHADGLFDAMVVGPNMRELIDLGGITDYEYVVAESDFSIDDDAVTAKGDFSPKKMTAASKGSHIVGDVVEQYIKWCAGKRAIVFATDVETANDMAARFNAAGIAAASVSAKTDTLVRRDMIRRFRDGRLHVLVNVDLFDEGFDVPACEAVILARPTMSLNKYLQMCGRALRIFAGKQYGLIIDMVSNYKRHTLLITGRPVPQTLDRREKRAKRAVDPDDIPPRACGECSRPYERALPRCPYCGAEPPLPAPGARSLEQVDGDLMLLDRERLAQMRAAMALEAPGDMETRVAHAAGPVAGAGARKRQQDKIAAQGRLQAAIEQWAGVRRHMGDTDQVSHRRLWLATGMSALDMLAADRSTADYERDATMIEGWYNG